MNQYLDRRSRRVHEVWILEVAHRETVESNVVVRRVDVSTIETEVVRVRSIRISSS